MLSKVSNHRIYLLLVVFISIAVSVAIYTEVMSASNVKNNDVIAEKYARQRVLAAMNKNIYSIVTPTSSPTPTSLPSPTPTPTVRLTSTPSYSGYCLNVPILMYHHTAPESLAQIKGFSSLNTDNTIVDQQFGYLSTHGFTSIFASTLVNALRNHTPLPSKSIVVSLDDGYQDVYDYAFPSAKKYNIKLSLMVPTGLMGVNAGTNTYYSWSELKTMLSSGLAEPDNHTFSHAVMGSQGPAKDQFEVSTAQQQLHSNLGVTSLVFAWPYGTNATNPNEYPVLERNGLLGAFSTIGGMYQCDSFIYSLHRTRVGNIPFPSYGIL